MMPGRPAAGMGAGMYSQDMHYGAFAYGMANSYGYGYHVPMYGPYPKVPAAFDPSVSMYEPTATPFERPNAGNFSMPPPFTAPPSAGVPPPNITAPTGSAPPDLDQTLQNPATDTS